MHTSLNEFLDEQKEGLKELAANLRKSRVAAARQAAAASAARIRSLNGRVRSLARSGVRLTAVSNGAVQSLIELQGDLVGAALNEAAERIERLTYTVSVRDLARAQAEVLQAARHRIVADIARAVTILKDAAGDARKVVVTTKPAATPAPRGKSKTPRGKATTGSTAKTRVVSRAKAPSRRPARKTTRRMRKAKR